MNENLKYKSRKLGHKMQIGDLMRVVRSIGTLCFRVFVEANFRLSAVSRLAQALPATHTLRASSIWPLSCILYKLIIKYLIRYTQNPLQLLNCSLLQVHLKLLSLVVSLNYSLLITQVFHWLPIVPLGTENYFAFTVFMWCVVYVVY